MQTFNSFNELAAGQTALATDMSVFNDLKTAAKSVKGMPKQYAPLQKQVESQIAVMSAALEEIEAELPESGSSMEGDALRAGTLGAIEAIETITEGLESLGFHLGIVAQNAPAVASGKTTSELELGQRMQERAREDAGKLDDKRTAQWRNSLMTDEQKAEFAKAFASS